MAGAPPPRNEENNLKGDTTQDERSVGNAFDYSVRSTRRTLNTSIYLLPPLLSLRPRSVVDGSPRQHSQLHQVERDVGCACTSTSITHCRSKDRSAATATGAEGHGNGRGLRVRESSWPGEGGGGDLRPRFA